MLKRTTILFLLAFLLLAIIHSVAVDLYLYWHIRWFDMPVHAYGGVIVALGLFAMRDLGLFPQSFLRLAPVLVCVLGVALVWEVYELAFGLPIIGDYLSDTAIDVALGVAGGAVGFHIGSRVSKHRAMH